MSTEDQVRAKRILKGAGWFAGSFFFAGSTGDALWAASNGLLDQDGVTDDGLAFWTPGKAEFPPRRLTTGEAA